MKTIEEMKNWRVIWTRTHIPTNPLHAAVLVETKEYGDHSNIVVTFTASAAWKNLDQWTRTTLMLANRVTGRTEDEVLIVPLRDRAMPSLQRETAEGLFEQLVSNQ